MSRLPNFDTFFPVFKGPHWIFPDGERYAVPALWGNSPIVYDPKKWDAVPDRFYPDLADPKYKGQLVVMDDPYTNLFDISQALGHKDPMYLTQAELDDVVKAFKEVKKNIVAIVGGGLSDLIDLVVRGDASMIPFQGWQPQVVMARDKEWSSNSPSLRRHLASGGSTTTRSRRAPRTRTRRTPSSTR
jgi:putative spermidine/putrescine transport system substrate-binding protein/spermidine/putrescine transport system substrate-binding protein